jgi:D-3-phosphoglycerate dehydrogenase / 2-oxoglutarate reductase
MAEVKHERAGDYHSMMRLTVTAEKCTRAVTGTPRTCSTTLLDESEVNIATFHLGRDAPGGSAIRPDPGRPADLARWPRYRP